MEQPLAYRLYLTRSLKLVSLAVVVGFTAAVVVIFIGSTFSPNWKGPPWFFGVFLLAAIGWNVFWVLSLPHKIELYQDGTIEFVSVLKRRNVQARDIVSIKPDGTSFGFLVVRSAGSKIRLLAQFDGFHDFLARVKALNPTVELRGC